MSTETNTDPNAGLGGAYVIQPETQEAVLVERTEDAPRAADAPADQPAAEE